MTSIIDLRKPIPQSQDYHDLADRRRLFGIPNALDVLSNVPFVIIGAIGAAVAWPDVDAVAFFIGNVLTGAGSMIYHLNPNDRTLAYDRYGMAVAFMAFLSMIFHLRVGGMPWLLPVLIVIGVASVAYWRRYDDLRPYGFVQFFPILLLVVLLLTTRARYRGEVITLVIVIAAYAAAKAFEFLDHEVYRALRIVSGHTLKHLAAACAPLAIAIWIAVR